MADENQQQTQGGDQAATPAASDDASKSAPAAMDMKALRSEIRSTVREAVKAEMAEHRQHLNQVRNHVGLPAVQSDGSVTTLPRNFHAYVEQVVREKGGNPNSDADLEAATPEARQRWEADYPPAPQAEEALSQAEQEQLMQLLAKAQASGLIKE